MKNKRMGRAFRLRLLCVFLCIAMAVPMTGVALAFDGSGGEAAITIRITPPKSWTEGSGAVEVRITDNVGAGFKTAQVKAGTGNWRDITAELEQTENRWYTVVDVSDNCTVYVRVTGMDATVYEKSQFIQCFDTNSDKRTEGGNKSDSMGTDVSPGSTTGLLTPPGGQGTVIDNASGTPSESGREFFTIATPNENVFYLVIDRKKDSENVYFLNAVTESDLFSLAEKDKAPEDKNVSAIPNPVPVCTCTDKCAPGEVKTDCPVCVLSLKDCTGKAPAIDPGANQEAEKPEKSNSSTMIVVVIAALAVGGAGYYLKIWKPKHEDVCCKGGF